MKKTKTHFSPPGGILKREFLDGYGLSVSRAAELMEMPRSRLNEIVRGERAITVDSALRLGQLFGTGAQFWLSLQSHYDLAVTEPEMRRILRRIPAVTETSSTAWA